MAIRFFIVHRIGANPNSDWYQWLKEALEAKGFQVKVPEFPNPSQPHISVWTTALAKAVGQIDQNTYFIGHSIGCQTILRYLESIKSNVKIGGTLFVAGWFHLSEGALTEQQKYMENEWIDSRIDFDRVREHMGKSAAVFSGDDPYVPISESKIFEKELQSKIITIPKGGHLTSGDGFSELPVALEQSLELTNPT